MRRLRPILIVAGVLGFIAQLHAQNRLDLSWLAGTWRAEQWGGVQTEFWSTPDASGVMFGSFSFVRDGKATIYELFAVEMENGAPVLRMRHFAPGLEPNEAGEALRFAVTQTGATEVLFRQKGIVGSETVLRYESPSAKRLVAEVIHIRDGKRAVQRFEFDRQ